MSHWHQGSDPDLDDELADRIVAAARRHRSRRWAILGACAMAVAAAVAGSLLAGGGDADGGAVGGAVVRATGEPSVPVTSVTGSPGPLDGVSARAQIYVAALSWGRDPQLAEDDVYVRDRVCESMITEPGSQCDDGPIPVDVQRQVGSLTGYPVHFVRLPRSPENVHAPALVIFGALAIAEDRATLGMEILCGPLCGQGRTLVLARTAAGWQVTGSTGPEWIS